MLQIMVTGKIIQKGDLPNHPDYVSWFTLEEKYYQKGEGVKTRGWRVLVPAHREASAKALVKEDYSIGVLANQFDIILGSQSTFIEVVANHVFIL